MATERLLALAQRPGRGPNAGSPTLASSSVFSTCPSLPKTTAPRPKSSTTSFKRLPICARSSVDTAAVLAMGTMPANFERRRNHRHPSLRHGALQRRHLLRGSAHRQGRDSNLSPGSHARHRVELRSSASTFPPISRSMIISRVDSGSGAVARRSRSSSTSMRRSRSWSRTRAGPRNAEARYPWRRNPATYDDRGEPDRAFVLGLGLGETAKVVEPESLATQLRLELVQGARASTTPRSKGSKVRCATYSAKSRSRASDRAHCLLTSGVGSY